MSDFNMLEQQEYSEIYLGKLWGFDTGAIFFVPKGKISGEEDELLQAHPKLMEKIIALCEEHFSEV